MTAPLDDEEIARLARHGRRTWIFFVAFWICALAGILAIELLSLSAGAASLILALIVVAVILGGVLQFSVLCPRCRANLGLQVRLGVPDRCRRCGVALTRPSDTGDT